MSTYNGHKNWNCWNVALWIANDEGMYNLAKDCIRKARTRDQAARDLLGIINDFGITHTPDGAKYTKTSIRAALVGL